MTATSLDTKPVRMKKRRMFVHVAGADTRVVTTTVVVQFCPNDLGVVRTGFTVTKKVGCAVWRNRIRRRLREAVRLSPDMPEMAGWDLVFIGRLATADRAFHQIRSDLAYALRRIQGADRMDNGEQNAQRKGSGTTSA